MQRQRDNSIALNEQFLIHILNRQAAVGRPVGYVRDHHDIDAVKPCRGASGCGELLGRKARGGQALRTAPLKAVRVACGRGLGSTMVTKMCDL
ncbi:hypothetical protein AOX56_18575 [Aeromonas sobria]|uniref:Uncharacterized protein n=1 Tax=Aeromonas sobria TaxID=646 RepID=A0A2N3IVP8_AERSO|nr:hypothetical protein AOX56_18575 [Aeromonas sobria]